MTPPKPPEPPAFPALEPEYADTYGAWKATPTPGTTQALLNQLRPTLQTGIRSYAPAGGPLAQSWAKEIALNALKTYNPAQGALRPHLMQHLQNLQRRVGRTQTALKVPERWTLDRMRVEQLRRELADDLLRDPTEVELADASGVPIKRLRKLMAAQPGMTESQIYGADEADDDESGGDPAVEGPDRTREHLELLLPELDPIDRELAVRRAGLDGQPPESLKSLARRLNLSSPAASMRLARVQEKLNRLIEARLISG